MSNSKKFDFTAMRDIEFFDIENSLSMEDDDIYIFDNIVYCEDYNHIDFKPFEPFVNKEEKSKNYCLRPQSHRFNRKILFFSQHRECAYCGYSPELDGNKEKYAECHKAFLAWEKDKNA